MNVIPYQCYIGRKCVMFSGLIYNNSIIRISNFKKMYVNYVNSVYWRRSV